MGRLISYLCLWALVSLSWLASGQEGPDDEFIDVSAEEAILSTTSAPAELHKEGHAEGIMQVASYINWWAYCALLVIATLAFRYRWLKLRAIITLLSLGLLGFYFGGCPCPVGASVQIFPALLLSTHPWIIPLSMLVLVTVSALLSGRVFCGMVCPIGALQELLWRPREGKIISYRWEKRLAFLPILVFVALVTWALLDRSYVFGRIDPFSALFNHAGHWGQWTALSFLLLISLYFYRPFCRYLCPLAFWLRIVSSLSWWKIKKQDTLCNNCGLCQKKCPASLIDEHYQVDNGRCLRCLECLVVCKKQAQKVE